MVWKRWKRDGGGKECGGAEGKGEEAGEWGKEGGGGDREGMLSNSVWPPWPTG